MVVKLPAKEKILIYLHENIKEQLPIKEKFPRVFSMEGITEKTDLSQPLVSYATKDLMRVGLLEKKRQYAEATGRFRNFYFLTAEGIMRAKEIEEYIGQLVISVREKDKIKDFKISDLIEHLKKLSKKRALKPMESREIISYTNILKNISPENLLDLKLLFAPKKYIDYSEKRPEIQYFVGRGKELKEIKEFIKSKRKILCVKGIAGIGKTTLLSKFVENLEMNIFWHRFTEFSTLRGLLTKISGFLSKMDRRKLENYLSGEMLGVEEILILLEEELKGINALFVFDDFQKANKEIVDFFRSFKDLETDVKTIIISRTIQRFYDRRDVIVKKNIMETVIGDLDKESSIKLLKHRKIEKDLERLYLVTKGHPLMLKLITPETKAEAEEFLREEILKKLGPRERKALEISSVFRYPFPSMAIINDMDYTTLDNLVDKSLMQRSGDVYDLHDTIREFFYRRLSEKEKTGYHKIVAKYYEKQKYEDVIIEAIYHYIHANRYKKAAGLAIDNGDRIISRGFAPEFLIVLSGLDAAGLIKISNLKAECCYNIGKWDEALKYYQAPLKFTKTLLKENLLEIAKSHIGIGKIYSKRGIYEETMSHFKKALKIFEENNSVEGVADTHAWLSGLYLRTGKLATAMRHINKCQKLSKSIGDTTLYGEALMDKGNIYHLRGDYRKSIGLYKESVEIAEKFGDKYTLARAYNNIGTSYSELNDADAAISWYKKGIKLSEKIGDVRSLGYSLGNIGEGYIKNNELDKCLKSTEDALKIFEKLGEKRMIAYCHLNYGIVHGRKKFYESAEKHYHIAIKIATKIQHLEVLSQIYFRYGKMYKNKGDITKAKKQFENALKIYKKLGNEEKVKEIKKELEKVRMKEK